VAPEGLAQQQLHGQHSSARFELSGIMAILLATDMPKLLFMDFCMHFCI